MNTNFKIIENNYEEQKEFGFCYGAEYFEISMADILALLKGKCLATTVNGDEYTVFITLDDDYVKNMDEVNLTFKLKED